MAALEAACGAGIEVTEEEIKACVDSLIEKNKEALLAQRYCFPIAQLMYAMKEGRMKWADGKKSKEILDAAILATGRRSRRNSIVKSKLFWVRVR